MFWIIAAISFIGTILFGAHIFVYRLWIRIFPFLSRRSWRIITKSGLWILGAGFLASSFLVARYDNLLTRLWYMASSIWLGFLLYFFLAALLAWAVSFLYRHSGRYASDSWRRVSRGLMVAALAVSLHGLYQAQDIKVTEYSVSLPNLPDSWRGRRAVFYADVHLGQIYGSGFSSRLAQKVRELNPDIIFDGGDLFDGVAVEETKVTSPLASLRPPLGYYFVTGNHEEYGDSAAFAAAIREAGITILDNEKQVVDGVQVIGVDYARTDSAADLREALSNLDIDLNSPSILIKHVPSHLDEPAAAGVDLQLSGHTHRAQVFPFAFITSLVYQGYDYGLKFFGGMKVLTTSGVGTWGPPLRVGSGSEIVLITFE